MNEKTYLGDGVYAEPDGYDGLILTTENGGPVPTNTIYLESDVLAALVKLAQRMGG